MPRKAQKNPDNLSERLSIQAQQLRAQAATLDGPAKDALLRKADRYDAAGDVNGSLRPAELRPPK